MKWMTTPGVSKEVPDGELVTAIMEVCDKNDEPAASTGEVKTKTGLSQPTALDRLKRLRDEGIIDGKQFGNGWGWWVR